MRTLLAHTINALNECNRFQSQTDSKGEVLLENCRSSVVNNMFVDILIGETLSVTKKRSRRKSRK